MADTKDIIAQSLASLTSAEGGNHDDSGGDSAPEITTENVEALDTPAPSTGSESDGSDDAAGSKPVVPEPVSTVTDKGEDKTAEKGKDDKKDEPAKDDKTAENDDFDKEPEFTTDAKGRKTVNRIPQPRVKVMVEKAVERVKADLTKQHETETSTLRQQLTEMESIGAIMEREPDRFIQMLAQANPAYGKYVQGASAAAPAGAARATDATADDPMPQPDRQLADGTPAYSPEGFQKVQDWQARQVEKRVLAQVNDQFKWITDIKTAQDAQAAAIPHVRAQIAEAEQWEGFKDNQEAILTELRNDRLAAEREGRRPKLQTLHDAYRVVMNRKMAEERDAWAKEREKLATDRNKQREELLAELKGRPASTATVPATRPVAASDANDGPRDTRSIIADTLAKLKAQRA